MGFRIADCEFAEADYGSLLSVAYCVAASSPQSAIHFATSGISFAA